MIWLIGILLGSLGGAGATPTEVTTSSANRLGIVTPSVLLIDTGEVFEGEVQFSISGDTPVSLEIDLLDVWSNDQGQRITLPLGSTPLSATDRLAISSDMTRYVPSGETQIVTLSLSSSADSIRNQPLAAGVRITLLADPDTPNSENVNIISAALAFVFAGPNPDVAASGGFSPGIVVNQLGVTPKPRDPDQDSVRSLTFVEQGPVAVFLDTTNEGNLFAFTSHTVTITQAGWWVLPEEATQEVFSHSFTESVLLPGQSQRKMVDATVTVIGSTLPLDVLTEWGLYSLTAETLHHTGGGLDTGAGVTQTHTVYFIVFPIRQALTLVVIAALVLVLVFRAGRQTALSKEPKDSQFTGPEPTSPEHEDHASPENTGSSRDLAHTT